MRGVDFGVHAIDQAIFWFGCPTLLEDADDADGGIEANAVVCLHADLPSGPVEIQALLSRTHDIGYTAVVDFERASVEYSFLNGFRLTVRPDAPDPRRQGVSDKPAHGRLDGEELFDYFGDQFQEFAVRIGGGPEVNR